ncbi:hypothetical protein ON010_g145 [Phytophthora cinnamomi]|nr:hypothetical protein ON010_g145 [Phytophthora cinnamomi]
MDKVSAPAPRGLNIPTQPAVISRAEIALTLRDQVISAFDLQRQIKREMARGDVLESPFKPVTLSASDANQLQAVAKTILDANLDRYRRFMDVEEGRVDPNKWKLVRTKDQVGVYLERPTRQTFSPFQVHPVATRSALHPVLCVGPTPGTLDDVMLGVATREDSNDLSRAAVLSTLQTPTIADPFRSVSVKWTELDVRLKSMGLVKNHDCVYVEVTGVQRLPSGERVGYHLLHSVDIQEAHKLQGRIRAQLSVCSFFRQATDGIVSTALRQYTIVDVQGGTLYQVEKAMGLKSHFTARTRSVDAFPHSPIASCYRKRTNETTVKRSNQAKRHLAICPGPGTRPLGMSPFPPISLSPADADLLQLVTKTITTANFNRYQRFMDVDPSTWNLVKCNDQMKIYAERRWKRRHSSAQNASADDSSSDLQSMLCIGSICGTVDDVMAGIVDPSFKRSQTKTLFPNDLSGAVTLATVETPTPKDPFKSMSVKWLELDVRRRSMGYIKNRDYVCPGTGGENSRQALGVFFPPTKRRRLCFDLRDVDDEFDERPGSTGARSSLCADAAVIVQDLTRQQAEEVGADFRERLLRTEQSEAAGKLTRHDNDNTCELCLGLDESKKDLTFCFACFSSAMTSEASKLSFAENPGNSNGLIRRMESVGDTPRKVATLNSKKLQYPCGSQALDVVDVADLATGYLKA